MSLAVQVCFAMFDSTLVFKTPTCHKWYANLELIRFSGKTSGPGNATRNREARLTGRGATGFSTFEKIENYARQRSVEDDRSEVIGPNEMPLYYTNFFTCAVPQKHGVMDDDAQ